jgi:hypothetical protein
MYLYEKIALDKEREAKFAHNSDADIIDSNFYDNTHFIALMCSSSHTYGNALAFIQNWIINLFPKDLFKTIHVNSKIAHRQIRSTPNEFIKKTKPMIIFRPRIADRNEDRFMQGTKLIERDGDLFHTWDQGQLQPFFHDPQHNISIKYLMNRTVMYVDVICNFSTLMQQLDYYDLLANATRWDIPFSLTTCLESYLSPEMLNTVSKLSGVPLTDSKGHTKEFLQYMNQNSQYPITYKLQGSSKTKEFYRYYPVNIECHMTDLTKDEGDRVGNIMDQYQIMFTCKMEFNSSGFYYIIGENIHEIGLKSMEESNDPDLVTLFTDVVLNEDYNLQHGWHLYNRVSLLLENENDTLNLDQLLNDSILSTIKYHLDNGLPIYEFLDIRVRRQGNPIHEGRDYTIDWNTRELTFVEQNTYYTYSIIVYVNVEYVNDLIKKIYNLE